MDDPDCDDVTLMRTYGRFRAVNMAFAGWRRTYREQLRPRFIAPQHTVLDIGGGGGDVARALIRWARRDGVSLQVTVIDPDARAEAYVESRPPVEGLSFRRGISSSLVDEGASFDFVLSNHVLHHLSAADLGIVLADSEALARVAVVHSDLRRSAVAYVLFSIASLPFTPGTFIREDGLTSIRRSFTPGELRTVAAPGWKVSTQPAFRALLLWEHP